jgi:protein-S-isoprenylcysteine O-methyltransferase Ste14
VGQGLATFAAFAIAATVQSATLAHPLWSFWVGLSAIVGGSLLRRHCRRMLGSSFTGAVIVNPDQSVVDRGAYHYVRHPSYTAGTIMFLGIGLALANWIGLAVLVGAVSIVYGYRVDVEERALVTVIGDPYRRYMSRTKRFVPLLF